MYFCLNTDQIPKISYMNKTDMQEGWIHFLRTAEEYILYFVRRGTMYLREGDRKYEIREGEYILLQPGMTHVGYRESECSYYYIHFGAETLQELSCTEEGKIREVLSENRKLFYQCDPLGYEFYGKIKIDFSEDHVDRKSGDPAEDPEADRGGNRCICLSERTF